MILMMRRGQGVLEYAFMIGIAAAVIIAMAAYVKRGFQGHLRGASEQIGAGQYSKQDTTGNKRIVKTVSSQSVSTSTSTTVYGNGQQENEAMRENSEQQEQLRADLEALNQARADVTVSQAAAGGITTRGSGSDPATAVNNANRVAALRQQIADDNARLDQLSARYTELQQEHESLEAEYRDLEWQLLLNLGNSQERRRIRRAMRANRNQQNQIETEQRQNQDEQDQIRTELSYLNRALRTAEDNPITDIPTQITPYTPTGPINTTGMTLEQINALINDKVTELNALVDAYKALKLVWDARVIIPDQTTSNSSNIETGNQATDSLIDESLGSLGNDAWR